MKSIEFAFPVFKSRLTEEQDTIYTIQDAEPELDENGCVVAYPDETDEYENYVSVSSKKAKNNLRKETTVETVAMLTKQNGEI